MSNDKDRVYCTIDHANKQGDRRDFDPYQLWQKLEKRRKQLLAAEQQDRAEEMATRCKSQLT